MEETTTGVTETAAQTSFLHELMHEPKTWLALAFVTLLLVFGGKIKHAISKVLDLRAEKIAAELAQAKALRDEAESLRASYEEKLHHSVKEAEGIITDARAQAARLMANAEAEIKESLERRLHHMTERMEQQEQRALDEVRNHIVDITIAAAKSLIVEHFNNISSEQMVQHVIADLDRKVH